jgi:hypothetical protein
MTCPTCGSPVPWLVLLGRDLGWPWTERRCGDPFHQLTQETDPRCPTCGRKDSARYNPDLAVGARLNTACPDSFHTVQPTQETDPE